MKRWIVALIFLAILIFPASGALAASSEIVNYQLDVQLDTNGGALVTKTITYEFTGSYNGVYSNFYTRDIQSLDDLMVYCDGVLLQRVEAFGEDVNVYTQTQDGDMLRVRVYTPGSGGAHVYRYEYRMEGLAQRYLDTAELNYKLIDYGNEETLHNATVSIVLPGADTSSVMAYAHGGMSTGDISIYKNTGTLLLGPRDVPSGAFVEAHVLFPESWLADAPVIQENRLEAAIAIEEKLINDALAGATLRRQRSYLAICVYGLAAALIAAFMGWKYRLPSSKRLTPDPNVLFDYPAALAARVYHGSVTADALSGTLMELTRAGFLTMRRAEEPRFGSMDTCFTRTERYDDALPPHQAFVLDWLFTGDDPLFISNLNAAGNYGRARHFTQQFAEYAGRVELEAKSAGLIFGNGSIKVLAAVLLLLPGLFIAGMLCFQDMVLAGLVLCVAALCGIIFVSRVRTLTDDGELLYATLHALVRQSEGIAPSACEDWMQLMPIYVATGCTDPLVKSIERDDAWHDYPMPDYAYTGWHHDLHRLNTSMQEVKQQNASVSNPNTSSSSSSSYDSSGGGGGGGGGDGAW